MAHWKEKPGILSFLTILSFLLFLNSANISYSENWFDDIKSDQIKEINEEITLLNLINGLLLDEIQVKKIIHLAQKSENVYQSFQRQTASSQYDYYNSLKELKNYLSQNKIIPDAVEKRVKQQEKEFHLYKQDFFNKIKQIEKELLEVLNSAQIATIEEFQPCTIPPKDLSEPIRAGQSSSNLSEVETILDTARQLSQNAYDSFVYEFLDNLIRDIEIHFGEMTPQEKLTEKKRLKGVLDSARGLNDADFVVQREALAETIVQKYHTFRSQLQEWAKVASQLHGNISKAGQYLLNPRAIPLLRMHLTSIQKEPVYSEKIFRYQNDPVSTQKDNAVAVKKRKMKYQEFFDLLDLNVSQSYKAEEILTDAEQELWRIIVRPRDDGINIIQEIASLEQSPYTSQVKMVKFLELLSLNIPNSSETYLQRMNSIKKRIDAQLQIFLTQDQLMTYQASKIDILKLEK